MKNHRAVLFALIALALAGTSCRSRTDRTEGTVLLSISDFDGLPFAISLNTADPPFTIEMIVVRNVPKEPGASISDLQDVELRSYEVRFRRRDTGTRVPPPAVQGIFGIVPVNGTTTLENVPFLFSDQVLNQPLLDLRNAGVDSETGTTVIVLDVSIRFFGRTLSGDDVATEPATFTIEVRP
jgi:hypothetical protein